MKTIVAEYENDDGEEIEIELPTKYEVCGRCRGEGKHVNPNVDGHGITSEEWYGPDWDDESREMYMSGGYDVTCHTCKGLRVIAVVDEEAIPSEGELRDAYEAYLRGEDDLADMRAMEEMERRYGA